MATVTVRGVGEARTSLDEASVTLTFEAIEQKATAALAKVGERTQAVVQLCSALGIESAARVTACEQLVTAAVEVEFQLEQG